MKAKRFDHFLAFWQQFVRVQKPKTAPRRRVAHAKASLKAVLAR